MAIFLIMSTTSSAGRERVNSGWKRLSGAKSCVFSGKVASVVAEGWSLFLRFRGSIRESCPQDSESSISTRTCSKLRCSEHFWKMRSANVHDTVARARCHMTANSSPCGRVMLCFGLSLCECPKRLQTFFSFIFHSFIRSCIHSFQSFIRSFIYLFERSFVPSIPSFVLSFIQSFIQQGVTPTFMVVTSSPTA